MRTLDDWFAGYSQDHRNPHNQVIHWICVPAILWAVMAALWIIPVPASIGRPGFWCGMAMIGAFAFYWRRSKPIGLAMLVVFVAFGLFTEWLLRGIGPERLLWAALSVFVIAWVGQFIGHLIEGARPSFLTDLAYLLIGPAWLADKLMRRLRIHR